MKSNNKLFLKIIGPLMFVSILVIFFSCCKSKKNKQIIITENKKTDSELIDYPIVPGVLNDATDRTKYILEHYWLELHWADTTAIGSDALSTVFMNWINVLYSISEIDAASFSNRIITDGFGFPKMQMALYRMAESIMNDPNSPYRNEELFRPILQAMTEDSLIDETSKIRPRFLLEQLSKNRKGTVASDLSIMQINGKKVRLSQWANSPYLLLYFFNPDCHDCHRVSEILCNDQLVQNMCSKGYLSIAAVYPDKDLESWYAHINDLYPDGWLVGRLTTDEEQNKYYLPAIPNLYLLDNYFQIIMKDEPIEKILSYLNTKQAILVNK